MRTFSAAVNVRRRGRSEISGSAAVGAGTTLGLRPPSVPPPTAADVSTAWFGMTTRHSPTDPEPKLHRVLCLIVIGTEGTTSDRYRQLPASGREAAKSSVVCQFVTRPAAGS